MKRLTVRKVRKTLLAFLVPVLAAAGCAQEPAPEDHEKKPDYAAQMEEAASTPYGRYPETIVYTLGKLTNSNHSNMPDGDTYEDNAYTRYIKEIINVQNRNEFEARETVYDDMVKMAIADRKIPDVMVVQELEMLKILVAADMIEDLSGAYESCTSERIKEIYDSYEGRAFQNVMFDGRMMALPGTNIKNGPNLLWIRQDWLDKLGLDPPRTLDEVEETVLKFVQKDAGGNGVGKTVGLACDPGITGNYDANYQMDLIFSYYGAYPGKWLRAEDGDIVYGSVQPEAKEGLARLASLYRKGVLDNKFPVRMETNIREMIINGECGAFFGLWWAPNNPLMDSQAADPEAEWKPYLIPTGEGGECTTYTQDASRKYIVVRKGYAHPEIVMKMVSVLFDYERFIDTGAAHVGTYYAENVDPTARPLAVNVDYNDAVFLCTDHILSALSGENTPESLSTLERAYYESCLWYREEANPTVEQWAAYMSRIEAIGLLSSADIRYVENVYDGQTATMDSKWWSLKKLEQDAYLSIITGEQPPDYFDTFVKEWELQGGNEIKQEVNSEVKQSSSELAEPLR